MPSFLELPLTPSPIPDKEWAKDIKASQAKKPKKLKEPSIGAIVIGAGVGISFFFKFYFRAQ